MAVQDDERERELSRLFNLTWDSTHQRSGTDAYLDLAVGGRRWRIEVEVKSTTGETVSTARDVGLDHIRRWREKFFVIGYYTSEARRPELKRSLCLSPADMEPWIASIEDKTRADFELAARAERHLDLDDLHAICGIKSVYSVQDAKRLHKSQWSSTQYASACDEVLDGRPAISPPKMLEILRLRLKYIAERGATLNNPHITKQHLARFAGTDREVGEDWAAAIRRIAADYIERTPKHPFKPV
jgi:hypothetical protein